MQDDDESARDHTEKLVAIGLLDVDFEPAEIDREYPVAVDIASDIADGLWQINEELNRRFEGRLPLFDIARCQALRRIIDDTRDKLGMPARSW